MSTPLHPDFDDPLKMAYALRFGYDYNPEVVKVKAAEHIERLVAENAALREAVAAEREACAKVAERSDHMGSVNLKLMKNRIAAEIRSRA